MGHSHNDSGGAFEIYNVADDEPAPPNVVTAFAFALLGKDAPREVSWEEAAPTMSAMARSFYSDSKRVRNSKLKSRVLAPASTQLLYATYRDGLPAVLQRELQLGIA